MSADTFPDSRGEHDEVLGFYNKTSEEILGMMAASKHPSPDELLPIDEDWCGGHGYGSVNSVYQASYHLQNAWGWALNAAPSKEAVKALHQWFHEKGKFEREWLAREEAKGKDSEFSAETFEFTRAKMRFVEALLDVVDTNLKRKWWYKDPDQ